VEEQNSTRSFAKTLRGKITIQTLLIGLIPVLAVGALAFQRLTVLSEDVQGQLSESSRQLAEDVVGANLRNTAGQIAGQIDLFMRERISDALVWSKTPVIIEAARRARELHRSAGLDDLTIDQVEARFTDRKSLGKFDDADEYLKSQIALSPHFGEAFFTDSKGFNVGLTNPTSDFVQDDEGWWQDAWKDGISIGDVEYDDSAGIWSIEISVRIDDPRNKDSLGVMKTVLGVSLIQQVATDAASKVVDGQVTVANGKGLLLAETYSEHARRRIMNDTVNVASQGIEPVRTAFGEQPIGFGMDGETVVGFAKSSTGDYYANVASSFKGFGWVTVVEQRRDTAFAPIAGLGAIQRELEESRNTLGYTLVAALVVVVALAIWVADLLSRSITVPVLELRDIADRVSRGDTSTPVAIESDDEVGDLARDFERMRKSLEVAMRRLRQTA
jgi:HAMP domain-containing protein